MRRDENCTLCPLHESAQTVCMLGKGPEPCDVMAIGEAPGQREDERGLPFVGRSGQLLDEMMNSVGLNRKKIYVTNAVNCRPPDNRTPKKREIDACRKWLKYQLAMVKPKYVLLLGNVPLEAMLGLKGIRKLRGRPIQKDGMTILPTYHPSYVLRGDGRERTTVETDLKLFKEIVEFGGIPEERALDITIVDSWGKVEEMIDAMTGVISCDIETTCLYPWDDVAKVVTVGIGTDRGEYIIPVNHKDFAWPAASLKTILARLRRAMARCFVVFQGGKFDCLWMRVHFNEIWHNDFDTLLAHYLIDENSPHDLEFIAQLYFGAPKWDIPLSEKQGNARLDVIAKYHAHDLYYTRKAYFKLAKELDRDKEVKRVFTKILMPAARLFVEMEERGCYIDQSKMGDAEKYLLKEMADAEKRLSKWGAINWGSPKQVSELLYGKLKIKCPMKTKKGANSTAESALKQIDHPCVIDLLKFRGAKQQHSFFIEGWKPFIVGSRIHPSFKLHGAVTGRPSCVRGGTRVMVPGGIKKVEDIKKGDWVYTFDDQRRVCLKRVTQALKTGEKPCKRVHWVGKGGQHKGFLDITDDHLVRKVDGEYVEVNRLKRGKLLRWNSRYRQGEHVMALHRQTGNRNFLYATGYPKKLRENRVVFEGVYGWSPEHVHHKDDNCLNDDPGNLEGMTRVSHTGLHAKRWRVETPSKIKILKTLKKMKGNVVQSSRLLECDRSTLKRRMNFYGINNHMITRIEDLPGVFPVYDLSIEDTHNFIANEICVHNCEHPNFQQVPRDTRIRSLIVAPKGYSIVEADLSQIELRIVAELSQCPSMMEAFRNGIDIHWKTALGELERYVGMPELVRKTAQRAKQMKKLPDYAEAIEILLEIGPDVASDIDPVWKELRKKAKAIGFGYVFGMWWKKFLVYARDNYDLHLTPEEAQQSRIAYFQLYPLEEWHRKQKRFAWERGFVRTLFGRKRRLPNAMQTEDTPERADAQRQAINAPVQGCATDLNLAVLLQMRDEFPDPEIFQPTITVHDSILAETRNDYVERVIHRFEEVMKAPTLLKEFDIDFSVPIMGETKIGPWGSGVSLAKWKQENGHGNLSRQKQI